MAAFHGKDGELSVGSDDAINLSGWSITITRDSAQADIMGTDLIAQAAGHYSWSGTCEGYLDKTTDILSASGGDSGSLTINCDGETGDVSFTGEVEITETAATGSVDGYPTYSISFIGTGAITAATGTD